MEFAGGKIVMALEGGYNLNSLANSALACVQVLLDHKPIAGFLEADPFESTWRVIKAVQQCFSAILFSYNFVSLNLVYFMKDVTCHTEASLVEPLDSLRFMLHKAK